jgi:predicted DCC family thiol-disulfide oxidoreductase YuxK
MIQHEPTTLTLYFDGSCPLCLAEMDLLRFKDQAGVLKFEDITAKDFSEQEHGITCELAMKSIKGRLSSGEHLDGIQVFAKAYEMIGMKVYARFLAARSLQGLLTWGYLQFAKHRHLLSKILGPIALKLTHLYIRHQTRPEIQKTDHIRR